MLSEALEMAGTAGALFTGRQCFIYFGSVSQVGPVYWFCWLEYGAALRTQRSSSVGTD